MKLVLPRALVTSAGVVAVPGKAGGVLGDASDGDVPDEIAIVVLREVVPSLPLLAMPGKPGTPAEAGGGGAGFAGLLLATGGGGATGEGLLIPLGDAAHVPALRSHCVPEGQGPVHVHIQGAQLLIVEALVLHGSSGRHGRKAG